LIAKNYFGYSLDQNYKVIGIFLDIKKGFDTVNNSLLLIKHGNAGKKEITKDLFESYLNNTNEFC